MLQRLDFNSWESLIPELLKESAINYFNLLGIIGSKRVYDSIYIQKKASKETGYIFIRSSGTVKIYAKEAFDWEELLVFLKDIYHKQIIVIEKHLPNSIVLNEFDYRIERRSVIAQLNCGGIFNEKFYIIDKLDIKDIDEIIEVYKEAFQAFASKEDMERKLLSGRGHAYGIRVKGELVSVCQTDFDYPVSALIVGVATKLEYRNSGFASLLLKNIINRAYNNKQGLYLQYDNLDAGRLYYKLGFREYEIEVAILPHSTMLKY